MSTLKNAAEHFLQRAHAIHGDRFDYDKVVYKNAKTRVIIGCPAHGQFSQTPDKHLNTKHVCQKCWDIARLEHGKNRRRLSDAEISWRHPLATFLERLGPLPKGIALDAKNYKGITTGSVDIICSKHGRTTYRPNFLLRVNNRCGKCGRAKQGPQTRSFSEFLAKVHDIHHDDYAIPYPEEYENRKSKLTVYCAKHDKTFTKSGQKLLSGQKCSTCRHEELITDGTLSGGYNESLFAQKPELAAAPATIYYLRVGLVWKIGITRNKLSGRLSHIKYEAGDEPQVLDSLNLPLREAFLLEQAILKDFQRVRTYAIWSSEVFTEDVLADSTLQQYAAAFKTNTPLALA